MSVSPVSVGDRLVAPLELSESEKAVLTGKWSVRHQVTGTLAVVRGMKPAAEEVGVPVCYSCSQCLYDTNDCLDIVAVRQLVERAA